MTEQDHLGVEDYILQCTYHTHVHTHGLSKAHENVHYVSNCSFYEHFEHAEIQRLAVRLKEKFYQIVQSVT